MGRELRRDRRHQRRSCALGGCTDPYNRLYNEKATYDNGQCAVTIIGCPLPSADNYMEEADKFSLEVCKIYGCTDRRAVNFDGRATYPLNSYRSCVYQTASGEKVPGDVLRIGCPIPRAENYDPLAPYLPPIFFDGYSSWLEGNDAAFDDANLGGTNVPDPRLAVAFRGAAPTAAEREYFDRCWIGGCMDVEAKNFDPMATFSEAEACEYDRVGCMQAWAENYDIYATRETPGICRKGGCLDERLAPCAPCAEKQPYASRDFINKCNELGDELLCLNHMMERNDGSWSPCKWNGRTCFASYAKSDSITCPPGAEPVTRYCYDAGATYQRAGACGRVVEGCLDPAASTFLKASLEKPEGVTFISRPEQCIFQGCGDPLATNFDSKVTNNVKALCEYPEVAEVPGCTDSRFDNYDPEATFSTRTCRKKGCTLKDSPLYDELATHQDPEACLVVHACLDKEASNYVTDDELFSISTRLGETFSERTTVLAAPTCPPLNRPSAPGREKDEVAAVRRRGLQVKDEYLVVGESTPGLSREVEVIEYVGLCEFEKYEAKCVGGEREKSADCRACIRGVAPETLCKVETHRKDTTVTSAVLMTRGAVKDTTVSVGCAEEEKPQKDEASKGCCRAMTASCVACSLGISVEELCMVRPKDFFDCAGVADEVVVTLPVVAPPPPPPVFDARDTSDLDSIRAYYEFKSRQKCCRIGGCTKPAAANYDSDATFDDGSCVRGVADSMGNIYGCTDPAAVNYRPLATLSNGKCNFAGCMDSRATNFDARATLPKKCEYEELEVSVFGLGASAGCEFKLEEVLNVTAALDAAVEPYTVELAAATTMSDGSVEIKVPPSASADAAYLEQVVTVLPSGACYDRLLGEGLGMKLRAKCDIMKTKHDTARPSSAKCVVSPLSDLLVTASEGFAVAGADPTAAAAAAADAVELVAELAGIVMPPAAIEALKGVVLETKEAHDAKFAAIVAALALDDDRYVAKLTAAGADGEAAAVKVAADKMSLNLKLKATRRRLSRSCARAAAATASTTTATVWSMMPTCRRRRCAC